MNRDHIICTCNGVTVGQIEEAVRQGDRTFEDVQERLHIGRQCVKCKDMAKLLIESFAEDYI